MEFRVIIAGSRAFTDYNLLKNKCDFYLQRKLLDPNTEVIVISGGASGADTLGEKYAKERNLRVERYNADWKKYGKSAGYRRNKQMAEVGNALIAFRSGYAENKGTDNMINVARSEKLLVRVVDEDP